MKGKTAKTLEDYIGEIYKSDSSTPKTKEMVEEYHNNMKRERKKYSTIWTYLWVIRYFFFWFNRPLEQATKKDLDDYILFITEKNKPKTVETRKLALKRFYSLNGMDGIVKHLKFIRPPKSGTKPVLNREELSRILDFTEHVRDRALIMFLYESGCRVSEALAVNIGDLNFDEYGCMFEVSPEMKTGARKIRLVECVPVLKEYIQWHPFRTVEDHPLWVRIGRQRRGRMSSMAVKVVLNTLEKRTQTKIHLHAHLFRRSRATELAKVLSNQQLRRFFGWASNEMIDQYVMHDDEALDSRMIEINGGEPKRASKRIPVAKLLKPCPKCKEKCTAGARFCPSCGLSLTNESIKQYEEDSFSRWFMKGFQYLAENDPKLKSFAEEAAKKHKNSII